MGANRSLADVNQLSRDFAHDMNPKQATVISSEDQLDQTLRRPHDLRPRAVLKVPSSHLDVDALLSGRRLGHTDHCCLGNGVHPYGGRGSTVSLNGIPKA